jgi:hypothetical protein
VLADYQANYRRYVEKPLGDKAVAAITAADVRAFRLARHPTFSATCDTDNPSPITAITA